LKPPKRITAYYQLVGLKLHRKTPQNYSKYFGDLYKYQHVPVSGWKLEPIYESGECPHQRGSGKGCGMRIKLSILVLSIISLVFTGCNNKTEAPSVQLSSTRAQQFADLNSEVFSSSIPAVMSGKTFPPGGKGYAELLNNSRLLNVMKIKKDAGFLFEGWAIDDKFKTVPTIVIIHLSSNAEKGDFYAAATRSTRKRSDLVEVYKEPTYESAGYILKGDLQKVPPGKYAIKIIQLSDRANMEMSTGITVEID
jgi:hypothetical protein